VNLGRGWLSRTSAYVSEGRWSGGIVGKRKADEWDISSIANVRLYGTKTNSRERERESADLSFSV
jgi:hypothetical protein